MANKALIFSGQGAQAVGMGKSLYDASPDLREYWDRANGILGWDLKNISFNGPDEELTQTKVCQPALYVHGYAAFRLLESRGLLKDVSMAFGLSLGEVTALAAAQVFDFETGLKIVAKRGELMQSACEASQGAMACVLGGAPEDVEALCKENDIDAANFNCPGQIVISGESAKVAQAIEAAKDKGFKRVIPLNVAGAYHSRLMQPAADAFADFLRDIHFENPQLTVLTNVTGQEVSDPQAIKDALVAQVVSSVRFEQNIQTAASAGVTEFFECGPGKVLAGLIKRTDKSLTTHSISEHSDLDAVIASQA